MIQIALKMGIVILHEDEILQNKTKLSKFGFSGFGCKSKSND